MHLAGEVGSSPGRAPRLPHSGRVRTPSICRCRTEAGRETCCARVDTRPRHANRVAPRRWHRTLPFTSAVGKSPNAAGLKRLSSPCAAKALGELRSKLPVAVTLAAPACACADSICSTSPSWCATNASRMLSCDSVPRYCRLPGPIEALTRSRQMSAAQCRVNSAQVQALCGERNVRGILRDIWPRARPFLLLPARSKRMKASGPPVK